MRIGWLTACDYEWTQHWRVASGLGVTADDLLGVRDWQRYDGFGPTERAVLAATDDVVRNGKVSAESWAACERELHSDKTVLDRARHRRWAHGEWSHRFCTASRSHWKRACPAGRRTGSHRRSHTIR